jgi:hypothetical protein
LGLYQPYLEQQNYFSIVTNHLLRLGRRDLWRPKTKKKMDECIHVVVNLIILVTHLSENHSQDSLVGYQNGLFIRCYYLFGHSINTLQSLMIF